MPSAPAPVRSIRIWLPLAAVLAVASATLLQCRREPATTAPTKVDTAEPVDRIHLLISGSMLGRLEPCGCASGQLGGLPRRMQHLAEQRGYDLLIEGGDLVEGATELDVQKAQTALTVLFGMQHSYDVLGVGRRDLQLPAAEWSSYASMANVVATDLESTAADWPGKPFFEKTVRGQKVRVLSFTLALPATAASQAASEPAKEPAKSAPRLLAPAAAWQRGLVDADPSTLRVLLLHGEDTAARALVPQLQPQPDLVVCFDHGHTDPQPQPELVDGIPVLYPGIRGRMLVHATLARLPTGPRVGCELIPLVGNKSLPGGGGDPDARLVLQQHREQVRDDGVLAKMARQKPTANGASYVGNQTCAGCHPTAMQAWNQSKHAQAWATLVAAEKDATRYGWPVTAYPDCVSCHVVGYGQTTGFVDPTETPELVNVGCESCHGAGSAHAGSGGQLRLGLAGGAAPSVSCVVCHDFEQSPDFLYGDRWPKIEHGLEPHQRR